MDLSLPALRDAYRNRRLHPSDVIEYIFDRIAAEGERPVWISLNDRKKALQTAANPDAPLYGIPFAIKDNIDVAGMETTAACPRFSATAAQTATVVQHLLDAGAMLIGKTNMDQFATGLVGTRSPYGACSSVFNKDYISGGSSSGSAVAVAGGLVTFALGTDTAGSGRVPAAFNGIVGYKPTRGLLSTKGVVPACRSLDCVSIFTRTAPEAAEIHKVAAAFDPADPFSRAPRPGDGAAPWLPGAFRFGVPPASQLEFFGDTEAAELFQSAARNLESVGGTRVEIDFRPFRDAAQLLYSGPWVAERFAAVGDYLDAMEPSVRTIISGASHISAADTFRGLYRLEELRREADRQWEQMDVLLLPTTGAMYTHAQIQADPIRLNSNLGYYTNFVNLLDLAAVAIPAGFRSSGLPFGVTLTGRAFTDIALLQLASGCARHTAPGCIEVAVVGAHLTGQPLNWQLTTRNARLVRTTRTAPGYRLYALGQTTTAKPGLVRDPAYSGPGIEVEVWAVPEDRFGSFVAEIPPPLGIGNATLADGANVKCFICEPFAIPAASEITHFGGWRRFLAQHA